MANLSYTQWIEQGRNVKKGQRAENYLVSPDLTEAVAVFSEDQTEPYEVIDTEGWELVPADKWQGIKKAQKTPIKPKVIVDYMSSTDTTTVWCGNDKKAIGALQTAGYRFDMRVHRWRAKGRDPLAVVEGWKAWGYDVDIGDHLATGTSI